MIKRFFKWVGILILSLVLLAALSYGGFHLWEYSSGGKYVQFLKENNETKSLDESFSFKIMHEDIQKSKLILVGEIHGFEEPSKFDFDFFKYLHQNHGVNVYLAELDFIQSLLLNQFLDSGDQELLKDILKKWVVEQGRNNQDYFDKYLKLQEYYQSLSADNRFRFIGIDKVQDWALTANYLSDWLDEAPLSIQTKEDIRKLSVKLDSLKPILSNSPDSIYMLSHIQSNFEFYLNQVNREEVLFQNFKQLYKDDYLGKGKLYGYFGLFHVLQYRVNGKHPLASLIRESDLGLANQITSINFVMNESFMVMPSINLPEFIRDDGTYTKMPVSADNMLIMYMIGIKDFKRVTPEYHKSIFKMNAENSPYANSSRLSSSFQLLPVTDLFAMDDKGKPYVQYTVFVRNSDWAEPME
jgi:hypothetical protein